MRGDLAWIDDLVDLHGSPEAEAAWLRLKSELALTRIALGHLARLMQADPNSEDARRRRCPYCDPPCWERHADDCPYEAARAFVDGRGGQSSRPPEDPFDGHR